MMQRFRAACGRKQRLLWAQSLADQLIFLFPAPPGLQDVNRRIAADPIVLNWLKSQRRLPVVLWTGPPSMLPLVAVFRRWNLPEITTVSQLADWLGLSVDTLEWLADEWSWERKRTVPTSRNYHYRWLYRPGKTPRLIEIPKRQLRAAQRQILRDLLNRVPPHAAAHGFRPGRSVVSFVTPHVGQAFVAKVDLRNFFGQIRRPRITALFRTLGYPLVVARLLAALCTNAVPASAFDDVRCHFDSVRLRQMELVFFTPHLPQGAPTSPALANLISYRLDCRLRGLLTAAGGNYTRYADDLIFSGDGRFARQWPSLKTFILAILLDEGFPIRERKSREMPRSQQQQAAGLVINTAPHVSRKEFDALKACLFNCVRFGPQSQNHQSHASFRQHLQGRISHVRRFQPAKGEKLQRLMDQIDWSR